MIKIRPYQWEAICAIWNYFSKGNKGNPVVAMPTGTGKSLVIAGFIRLIYDYFPNQRVIVLTHVKELIRQNHSKMEMIWPNAPAGIYSSGLKRRDVYNNIIFAGIASVAKRAAQFGHVDLILIDEAHLVSPKDTTMYQKFIADLKEYNPQLKVIGFTATPWRLKQGRIDEEGGLFTDVCFDNTRLEDFNRLIQDGYLSPLIPKRTNLNLDVNGVHERGGEFIPKELQQAVDKFEISETAVKESIESAEGRTCWLVFTAGVDHALHVAEILESQGVSAKAVHSRMKDSERDKIFESFTRGEFVALVNSDMATTGFDHPYIDLIVVLRPTKSPGLWVQMLGRGTRPVYADGFDLTTPEGRLQAIASGPKQDCLVLDFGGNTKRLGPINDPVVPVKGKKRKGQGAPIKLCDGLDNKNQPCDTWVHASLRFCPHCGNEFEFKSGIAQAAGTEEVIRTDEPVVEEFKVSHIAYALHTKTGKPNMMKVTYYCNLQRFSDYVCFEHEGFAQKKAQQWWKERTSLPFPESTEEGLGKTASLSTPTSLRVWTNKRYPEILAYCFNGTHFGKEEEDPFSVPSTQNAHTKGGDVGADSGAGFDDEFDDYIPF